MNIIEKIDAQITALEKKKAAIRQKCSHPSVTERSWFCDGNTLTGRDESAGIDYTCDLCGYRWTKVTK